MEGFRAAGVFSMVCGLGRRAGGMVVWCGGCFGLGRKFHWVKQEYVVAISV